MLQDSYFTLKENNQKRHRKKTWFFLSFFLILILIGIGTFFYVTLPVQINTEKIITVPEGYTLGQSFDLLQQESVIRSSVVAQVFGRITKVSIKAGTYQFSEGLHGLVEVVNRFDRGDYGDVYIRMTIPEGSTNREIAAIINKHFPELSQDEFIQKAANKEGYLFPDTYLFLPDVSIDDIIKKLETTFTQKTKTLFETYASSRSPEDIVIMASLIEKEAGNNPVEQKTVSGILWKRIDRGMLLQVDAPFLYIQGKTSAQLSLTDLRTDGPYNTYTRSGLTPTPIGNPGLSAIEAALNPIDSLYFFYLHDNNGGIHYGVTHDEHVRNKQRYL